MLDGDRIRRFEGWGMAVGAAGYRFRPRSLAEVAGVLDTARSTDVPIVARGSGCSYGDAAILPEGLVLDFSGMNRVLAFDPATGVADVEPGVTVRQLWRSTLADGWWPPIVTGTMEPSIGGCLSMNVHGKNNWARGTMGDHCLELDLLTPAGGLATVSRDHDPELFHAVIGGFGQLGLITRARLQLKRVRSGLTEAEAVAAPDLGSSTSSTARRTRGPQSSQR